MSRGGVLRKWVFFIMTLGPVGLIAQVEAPDPSWERLINRILPAYAFTPDNLLRLAVYTELTGDYDEGRQALFLDFEGLGSMAFYPGNCLLRTRDQRVYHLSPGSQDGQADAINAALDDIFERVMLMGDNFSDPAKIRFVDQHLARKNLEPFEKIYLRYLLLRHGVFSSDGTSLQFSTDVLPPTLDPLTTQPYTPLIIRLDQQVVRGYYVRAGGTVYVENVTQPVTYATGETYGHNITAFKLFIQKFFVQSVQYVIAEEAGRLKVGAYALPSAPGQIYLASASPAVAAPAQPVLYGPYHWVPMMVGLLRSQRTSLADPDLLPYFVNQPFYPALYDHMTPDEKKRADQYVRLHQPPELTH